MLVYTKRRRIYHSTDRMEDQQDPSAQVMALLRELSRNQIQLNDTQWLMEETLRKLAESKVSIEQNVQSDNLIAGRANPEPTRSQLSIPTFPPWIEAQHTEQPTFQNMQEQLWEDWSNANLEGDITYKHYVDLKMRYSGCNNRGGYYNENLRRKIKKINLSTFDGSGTTRA